MEVNNLIIGSKLSEIQKKPDNVKLVFENSRKGKTYFLSFDGILLETSGSSLNRRVRAIQIDNTLGFRVSSQLRHLHKNPQNYQQIFIQMEGSNEANKLELLGAFKNYKILSRTQGSTKSRIAALKTTRSKSVRN
jgi:hypothetical protein